MMIPLRSLGYVIADSPVCPGGLLDSVTGGCSGGTGTGDKPLTFTPFTQAPGFYTPYAQGVQTRDPSATSNTDTGIDTAAGMVQSTVQNLPGVPDQSMIQNMVGAGAPGVTIQSGASVQTGSGMSTWILPGIIGLVVIYVISKKGGR